MRINFKQSGGEMKGVKIIVGFFAVIALILVAYAALRTVPISDCGENGTGLACIKLPPGFSIDYYAENVEGARSITLSPNGTLFVGSRDAGKVYAVLDRNNDSRADKVLVLAEGLDMPNGVAFRNGSLYVAEISRVVRYDDIEARLENPPTPVVVNDSFPSDRAHGWKYIKFGPDGKLYVPIGMPCNICNKEGEDERYGTIMRMEPNGSQLEIFARGIRNTVGFDWDPETEELWFTDNGRDWLGDDTPPDELNLASEQGMHFGFPYCHGGDIPDPEFGKLRNCSEFTPPEIKLGPHVASLGMTFYTGTMFPEEYGNQIFIAEHGSWNRKIPIGYRISLVKLEKGKPVSYEPFADGWLQGLAAWGRPVDILVMPDGALLVSDDKNNAIYRISYG
ncbi:sorbosone dehydrogenase family protein [Methanosarcina sp. Z-7115]|uniref:Sorbosone dehydrogenase family protein n=1 Tax=Methanosarcina baikalica TaxID=3073890 RepID=A0ABU2D2F9_9EURY|nr:sorbosone dehydrogenase family protein [Methanosarcina sp. Z-7115]MDR7666170.1 sorbosone dehydrogenase family protein [Methanosarcina sp. Z-7115]